MVSFKREFGCEHHVTFRTKKIQTDETYFNSLDFYSTINIL